MDEGTLGSSIRCASQLRHCLLAGIGWCCRVWLLHRYAEKLLTQISDLVALTRQSKLETNPRARVMSMITMDVHYRDVYQQLLDGGVARTDSFAWQSQLRTYVSVKHTARHALQTSLRAAHTCVL